MSTSSQPSTGQTPWNDINESKLAGRVGGKPEVRITTKHPVATTTLYVTNEYDTTSGRKKKVTRVPIIMHGEKGAAFAMDVNKGDKILVKGRMQENVWKDQEEKAHSRLELVVFEYSVLAKKAA